MEEAFEGERKETGWSQRRAAPQVSRVASSARAGRVDGDGPADPQGLVPCLSADTEPLRTVVTWSAGLPLEPEGRLIGVRWWFCGDNLNGFRL